jgi:photosystem II stability/assembly factor-like uncharacterized protein
MFRVSTLLLVCIVPSIVAADLDTLVARPIGPANMSGRVTAIAPVESNPRIVYVGAASGGVWKTIDGGTRWQPIFDQQTTQSIGDVAVAPSDPNIVWVGTGEANARNSVSWGDGVYRSTDAGKTWMNMGLKETHHIGRIVIHPKDPNIVYVAALGHLWGPNRERGLYKTTDGGKTWQVSKHIDEETGFIDLAIDPFDPETLFAAAYRVRRGPYSGGNPAVMYGAAAGLYRTRDGGKSWTRLTKGLPEQPRGRCGISLSRKNAKIVYAVVQTDRTDVRTVAGQAARTNDDAATGGIFRSADGGDSWVKLNDLCPRPFYFGQIRVDPADDKHLYVLGISLHESTDGGRTFLRGNAGRGTHADHHALWIDPTNSSNLLLGNDGGLFESRDGGQKWEQFHNLPLAQFYGIAVEPGRFYRIYGGLQDNGTWGGASRTRHADGVTREDWSRLLGADGFQCQVDPSDPNIVYGESQYGGLKRVLVSKKEVVELRPKPRPGAAAFRFNWNSPMLLSPHNPKTIYFGGNYVFRSTARGDGWEIISPDLTLGRPGPSTEFGHTITTLAESPLKAGVLWAGTDDGRLLVTRDGGRLWHDLTDTLPKVPAARWISRVECSPFAAGTAFVAVDRHRQDDRAPYLFRTDDYGATWKSIRGDLPAGSPVQVVRSDPDNSDLLYAGTEFGVFATLDGGVRWQRLGGLPAVQVYDLVVHRRERELVIATHGRGIFILDVSPLQQLTAAVRAGPAYLFAVKPALAFRYRPAREGDGTKTYAAPNPPYGAAIWYYVRERAEKASLTILNDKGETLKKLNVPGEPGLQRLQWDLRVGSPRSIFRPRPQVPPGDYIARVQIGERVLTTKIKVEAEE